MKILTSALALAIGATFSLSACTKHRPGPKDGVPGSAKGDQLGETPLIPNWFTKDSALDGVEGVSADRAYGDAELGVKIGVAPVTVAIIDGGVDITHEDLQGHIWTNEKELPDDGIDNDGNGYVDDIHGWNFLGQIHDAPLEVTRELVRMKALETAGPLTLSQKAYLDHLNQHVSEARQEANEYLSLHLRNREAVELAYKNLKILNSIDFDTLKVTDVEAIQGDSNIEVKKKALLDAFTAANAKDVARINRRIEYGKEQLNVSYSLTFDPRTKFLGDDLADFQHVGYGDNDPTGPDADHGTHVAGIIGAVRGNDLGIQGIATDVRFMSLRAVPNGDEYDKDIANAIRYAADNGARVINMSFGKGYSPYAAQVREAMMYAASKNVLIFHAAGNESADNDRVSNFPYRYLDWGLHLEVPAVVEVGASGAQVGPKLPADFSNYGQVSVDLFAPGVDIESTVTGPMKYDVYSGTSMASPAAAGVAALLISQYPQLTNLEVKDILLSSAVRHHGLSVLLPFDGDNPLSVLFETLSATGGVINARAALKEAQARRTP